MLTFKMSSNDTLVTTSFTSTSAGGDYSDSFWTWQGSRMDLEFVLFGLLFGAALLFYLAGSPHVTGWLSKQQPRVRR